MEVSRFLIPPIFHLSTPSFFFFTRHINLVLHLSSSHNRYEMRRQCQEIMPSFFLGPSEVSKSLPLLQSLQITSIVILRAQHESMFIKARFPQVLNYHTLDVEDREDQNLIRIYSSARDFIDQEIAKGGKVLVHDDGGISRAPAFAVM